MIPISLIRDSVAKIIIDNFPSAKVAKDPISTLDKNKKSFLIKIVDNSFIRDSEHTVERDIVIDIVYLPEMSYKISDGDNDIEKLAQGFLRPLEFSDRAILPKSVTPKRVDHDWHLTFNINFYDEIEVKQSTDKYMQHLELRLVLH